MINRSGQTTQLLLSLVSTRRGQLQDAMNPNTVLVSAKLIKPRPDLLPLDSVLLYIQHTHAPATHG
jgi:hypothetical protein